MLLSWRPQDNLTQGCSFGLGPPRGAETPAWVPQLPFRGGDNVLGPWATLREGKVACCVQKAVLFL